VKKNIGFFEIYGVSTRIRGGGGGVFEPVRTFFGQEEDGVNFSQFCVDVLYGRP